ncbi:putative signal peptidase [Oryza sativa Japonica Group]|uniref:Signal peptidase complex subunit 3 n=1 Tax=Oryza sativa subsp. japonica TaxID=39947 RepID=SPCS3_ORYSJ|nr:RecName: Full=Signal peptidase complex subunit 3; AltName: Full=Microsomal signal peptidase 22 kDa subunit; Short=SPC22; Short=SPase 22 kDa subunit [Oryza sativa Japonica Group]BAD52472.1 putative signal peptidase [Oryza sativa Japonica Group]
MHSWVQRLLTTATTAALLLLAACCAASALDAFHVPSVQAQAHVTKINRFHKQLNGNDKVFVFLTAEYENSKNSLNQVSLWDHIIPDKDKANLQVEVKSKYPLIDQGSSLRGKKVQLVLHWHVMPKAGVMIRDRMALSEFNLPDSYTS